MVIWVQWSNAQERTLSNISTGQVGELAALAENGKIISAAHDGGNGGHSGAKRSHSVQILDAIELQGVRVLGRRGSGALLTWARAERPSWLMAFSSKRSQSAVTSHSGVPDGCSFRGWRESASHSGQAGARALSPRIRMVSDVSPPASSCGLPPVWRCQYQSGRAQYPIAPTPDQVVQWALGLVPASVPSHIIIDNAPGP